MPGLDEQKKAQEELLKNIEKDSSDSILKQLKDQVEPSFQRPNSWSQKEKNHEQRR
jgi:hypothetical protein